MATATGGGPVRRGPSSIGVIESDLDQVFQAAAEDDSDLIIQDTGVTGVIVRLREGLDTKYSPLVCKAFDSFPVGVTQM